MADSRGCSSGDADILRSVKIHKIMEVKNEINQCKKCS